MKTIVTIALCFLMGFIEAQDISLKVVDSETQSPVFRAKVSIDSVYFYTDKNGEVKLDQQNGRQYIRIQKNGYIAKYLLWQDLILMNFEVGLELTGISLNEMVVSASKTEENQLDLSQKVEVVQRRELENMNQTSTADVLAGTGNVMVQKSQLGGGSPIIRGFETNKVLLVVDGVRMNNAIYRGGHLQNVITLDNAMLDRVEVSYGPGSVVYGSDALGGVMHFYTKNPVLSSGDSLLVQGAVYSRYNSASNGFSEHLEVNFGQKKWASLTAATYSKFGDLKQGSNRNPFYPDFGARTWYQETINGKDSMLVNSNPDIQKLSGYQQYDILQKFTFKPSENVRHQLNFQLSNSSDIPRYDRLNLLSGGKPKFAEWNYGPQLRFFSAYSADVKLNKKWADHIKAVVAYQHVEESRVTRKFNSDKRDSQWEVLEIGTLNLDADKKACEHEIRYGIDVFYNMVKSTGSRLYVSKDSLIKNDSRYPDGGSEMSGYAAYFTHRWEIGEKLILSDGLRYNRINLTAKFIDKTFFPFPYDQAVQNNDALNGNLGLVYLPADSWRFILNLSSGFRAPNVDDISKVFESVPGNIIVPNPNIKPEFTYNGEVGVQYANENFTTSATAYYTIYNNALTTLPSVFNGVDSLYYNGEWSKVTSIQNALEAYIFGTELRLSGNLTDKFSVYGTLNYTYGRIKTDTTDYPLDHIPPVFGKVGVQFSNHGFKWEGFVQYHGWKHLDDYNVYGEDNISNATEFGMPAWYTLNSRIGYQFKKYLSLQLACENILDLNYRVFASNISAPGRNFIGTLRYNF